MTAHASLILGSGSPQRLSLLAQIIDPTQIAVVSPDCEELPLDGTHTSAGIDAILNENVRRKQAAVQSQLDQQEPADSQQLVLCADTVVVVSHGGLDSFCCLGKPPTTDWETAVQSWFETHYTQGPHWVRTCFSISSPLTHTCSIVETEVVFRKDACRLLPWYFSTGEPVGKAGGYALQGAGSVFVEQVTGSISNVIGLPLEQTLDALSKSGLSFWK